MIVLRIATAKLTEADLAFNDEIQSCDQLTFQTVSDTEQLIEKIATNGITLTGRKFSHTLHKNKVQDIVISADEITPDAKYFLISFWTSNFAYVCTDGTTYEQVITDQGRIPLSYIDGLLDLPEISFTLNYVEPQ